MIGAYRLEGEIGRGAMGTVYAARHPQDGSLIALKTLEVDEISVDTEVALERFRREVMVTSSLHHPGIVRVFEAGQAQLPTGKKAFFLAMELVKGETLHTALKRGSFVPEQAAAIVVKLLDSLNFAHGHGIVHRDVKPGNVFIAGDERVVLVDFGICKIQDMSSVTHANAVMGTLPFMAPEQLLDDISDPRADVFAAGSLLYTLLTRRYLRPLTTVNKILRAVQAGEDLHKVQNMRGFDPGLLQVLERSLQPDPNQRYQKAREMMNALWPYAGQFPKIGPQRVIPESFSGKVYDVSDVEFVDPDEDADRNGNDSEFDSAKPPSSRRKKLDHSAKWYREKSEQQSLGGLAQRQHKPGIPRTGQLSVPQELRANGPDSAAHKLATRKRLFGLFAVLLGIVGVAAAWYLGSHGPLQIELRCLPGAGQLVVDNKIIGPSPQRLQIRDRSATVRVACEAPGMLRAEKLLQLPLWGRSHSVTLVMSPLLVELTLRSDPPGATVIVDGQAKCKTPCTLPGLLPQSTLMVGLEKPGFSPVFREFKIGQDPTMKAHFRLQVLRPEHLSLLVVTGKPGTVLLDGAELGASVRSAGILLGPGTHQVVLGEGTTRHKQTLQVHGDRVYWLDSAPKRRSPPTSLLSKIEVARLARGARGPKQKQQIDRLALGGLFLLSRGKTREAQQRFAQVLQLAPKHPAALRGKVLIAAQKNQRIRLKEALSELLLSGVFLDDSALVRDAIQALNKK